MAAEGRERIPAAIIFSSIRRGTRTADGDGCRRLTPLSHLPGRKPLAWQLMEEREVTTGRLLLTLSHARVHENSRARGKRRERNLVPSHYLISLSAGNLFLSRHTIDGGELKMRYERIRNRALLRVRMK